MRLPPAIGALFAIACSSSQPPPPEVPAKPEKCVESRPRVTITASEQVNAGPDGRGLPVQVRLYQLKSEAKLMNAFFEEVWNQGRVEAIDEMLAEHSVIHGLGGDLRGPAGFKPFHASYRNAFPDVRIQVEDVVAENGMVAARWSAAGTHRGGGLGFEATGRAVTFHGMTFVRVEQGKLVEAWNVFDQLGMLQQIGVVPLP